MSLVSIIVPIYNVEEYLERCIKSLLSQTYNNIEIILVNDGSKDSSGLICDKYALEDSRIIVIHKENGGLSDARNHGIDASTGEYLMFIDSDDWIDIDTIELLLKVGKKYNADIIECSWRNIYSDFIEEETNCTGEIIEADFVSALEGMLDWKFFKAIACNKLYHRSTIGDVRYPKGKIHEDEFTTYKYFYNAKKLVYVDISKYNYYRGRLDSITGGGFKENNLHKCIALRERLQFFRENNINSLEEKMNNIYCWVLLECMYKCYQNNINGSLVTEVYQYAIEDLEYLKKRPVSSNYIKELTILSQGINKYGKYRKLQEDMVHE